MEEGNKTSKKIPARGISLACRALIWFVLIQLAVSFFTSEVGTFLCIYQFSDGSYTDLINSLSELYASDTYTALTGALACVVAMIWFGIRYKKEVYLPSVAVYGTLKERTEQTKPVMIVLAVALVVLGFTYLVQFGFQALYTLAPQTMLDYVDKMDAENLESYSAVMVIYTILLAPIAEELTFRGLILGVMDKEMNFWLANALQAFLFALVHGDLVQGTYTFVLGFIFGYILHKTQNILYPMLGHMVFNLLGTRLVDYLYMGDTPITSFICIFLSLAAVYAAYILINRFSSVEEKATEIV